MKAQPLYSLSDFEEKTGVKSGTLWLRMKNSVDAPKPVTRHHNCFRYKLNELQNWHNNYKDDRTS